MPAWIATGWLLAFAGFNAALYATWWRRTRDERTFLEDALAAGVEPIQAAWWLGASWDDASPQQQGYAAEVAVRLLIHAGDAEVDEAGGITARSPKPEEHGADTPRRPATGDRRPATGDRRPRRADESRRGGRCGPGHVAVAGRDR